MKTAPGTTLIRNGQLVDGTGAPPVPDAAVVIEDGRIRYAGAALGLAGASLDGRIDNPSYDLEIDARGGTISHAPGRGQRQAGPGLTWRDSSAKLMEVKRFARRCPAHVP